MYYENKNEIKIDRIIIFVLMAVIIALLCILIIKLDETTYEPITKSEYTAELLSTNSSKTVDNRPDINLEDITKCVVGISKLQNSTSSVFLNKETVGIGSGIILTDNGYILTNYHVSGNKYSNCYITLENGQVYNGMVVWTDSNIDLAIIKIDAVELNYIVLGDSDNIYLTQEVYAVGNPIGFEFQRTITKGIISGVNRTIKIDDENYMEDLIQTDATINEGNSGRGTNKFKRRITRSKHSKD
jgi:S1-C subfamily serine protease